MATTLVKNTPVRKKIKVSKNRKKSWGKACDIKDVEDYLEEKRFEERIGGRVADRKDDELFFLQTSHEEPAAVKKKFIKKPLRCHQNIGAYSKVPTPVDPDQIRYSKRIKHALAKAEKKKFKALARKVSRPQKISTVKSTSGSLFTKEFKTDLWGEETEIDPEIKDLVDYRDEITKKKPPKVPYHRYQKPSFLPSVEIPHAGASYNPSFDDHQELIMEAVQIELTKEREEMHLRRVLDDMFPKKADAPTEESMLEEMAQGLFDDEMTEEVIDSNNLKLSYNPPVSRDNMLTKSRKRKRKEMKEQARLKASEKLNKKRISEIYRLKSIKSELKAKEELSKERYARNQKKIAEKMYQTHKMGQHKYEPNDLEVNFTEDLRGSLRVLKTEGNLLEDRYKSFQRRNIIEPRIRQKRTRKYELKVQVKRSHRDFK